MRIPLALSVALAALLAVAGPLRAEDPPGGDEAAALQQRIEALCADLGANDFQARERASRELLALGVAARPALRRTMESAENLEARWRAEQILKRLDNQGERPVGEGQTDEPRPERPGTAPGPSPFGRGEEFEELLRKWLSHVPPTVGDRRGLLDQRREFVAPGLRLEVTTVGLGMSLLTLEVEKDGRTRRLHGVSLEQILAREPGLAAMPGWDALMEQWNTYREEQEAQPQSPFGQLRLPDFLGRNPLGPSLRGGGITIGPGSVGVMSKGVEIIQDGDVVRVRIRETGEDGEEVVREFEGESLEAIREQHPEVAKHLGGISVLRFNFGPALVFRGREERDSSPPPFPQLTPSEPATSQARFGVHVANLEPALAYQLGLEEGRGVMVRDVVPGSAAAALGVERYDVILSVDGRVLQGVEDAVAVLARVAEAGTEAPLTLDVIRTGQRITLSR